MRIFVTTAGEESYHMAQRAHFKSLAAMDDIGVHELVNDMSEAEAALFVDLQQHPEDTFLRVLRRHPLVRRHRASIYVYDERDFPFVSFPGIYPSATPSLARYGSIVGGPYPALPAAIGSASRAPDLLFSFRGARTHAVRNAVLALDHSRCSLQDTSDLPTFSWLNSPDDDVHVAAREAYRSLVARSKFVLAPRGHSPSSFRLYETLAAGRVPVVISDKWLAPPRVSWRSCVVRVRERDVARIPTLLEELEPRWPHMAEAAQRTYAQHFSPTRLWHHYATSLAGLRGATRRRPWWAQRPVVRLGVRKLRSAASRG